MPVGCLTTMALGAAMQVGMPAPSEAPNFPPLANSNGQYGFEGRFEPRYPFDTQQNWVHGYFQEIPAYGGHVFYRPYNYKDVLSQSQTAAGWGLSPTMPYSQQFWHRYHDQATMLKLPQAANAPATQFPVTQSTITMPVAQPMFVGQSAMPMNPPVMVNQPLPVTSQPMSTYPPQNWAQPTSYWSSPAVPTITLPPQTQVQTAPGPMGQPVYIPAIVSPQR